MPFKREKYAKQIIEWLFPQFAELLLPAEGNDPPELMPIGAARLLASLSLDPQVSLLPEQRQDVWSALWQAHLDQQHTGYRWHLAPALLCGSEYEEQVYASLIQLHPPALDLGWCTKAVDLRPLAGSAWLQSLDLFGCIGVVDLRPLAGLARLQSLGLEGCAGVVDLEPLAELAQLQNLNLSGCTGLSVEAISTFRYRRPDVRIDGLISSQS